MAEEQCVSTKDDTMELLSAALDEIYRLRRAMAYSARVIEAQTDDVKALGKGRREQLSWLVERMRRAVYSPSFAFMDTSWSSMERELERVAPDRTFLSVPSWREELAAANETIERINALGNNPRKP